MGSCHILPTEGMIIVTGLGDGVSVYASLTPLIGNSYLIVNNAETSSPVAVMNDDSIKVSVCAPKTPNTQRIFTLQYGNRSDTVTLQTFANPPSPSLPPPSPPSPSLPPPSPPPPFLPPLPPPGSPPSIFSTNGEASVEPNACVFFEDEIVVLEEPKHTTLAWIEIPGWFFGCGFQLLSEHGSFGEIINRTSDCHERSSVCTAYDPNGDLRNSCTYITPSHNSTWQTVVDYCAADGCFDDIDRQSNCDCVTKTPRVLTLDEFKNVALFVNDQNVSFGGVEVSNGDTLRIHMCAYDKYDENRTTILRYGNVSKIATLSTVSGPPPPPMHPPPFPGLPPGRMEVGISECAEIVVDSPQVLTFVSINPFDNFDLNCPTRSSSCMFSPECTLKDPNGTETEICRLITPAYRAKVIEMDLPTPPSPPSIGSSPSGTVLANLATTCSSTDPSVCQTSEYAGFCDFDDTMWECAISSDSEGTLALCASSTTCNSKFCDCATTQVSIVTGTPLPNIATLCSDANLLYDCSRQVSYVIGFCVYTLSDTCIVNPDSARIESLCSSFETCNQRFCDCPSAIPKTYVSEWEMLVFACENIVECPSYCNCETKKPKVADINATLFINDVDMSLGGPALPSDSLRASPWYRYR